MRYHGPVAAMSPLRVMGLLAPMMAAVLVSGVAAVNTAPSPAPVTAFGFSPVLGNYMVLQQSPAAAAVYGPATPGASAVTVTVSDGKTTYGVAAEVSKHATHQPYGYVDPSGAPLPVMPLTWKAVLRPATAGGDYTITATCAGCSGNTTSATLAHVTFGDMWYCSGQSNMWLPLLYTFSRNETVKAIEAGKYSNIRGMFSPSATTPVAGVWKTSQQAIADGNDTSPTYSLFDMGAACWYFAQGLAERGVATPIGIADTAIGGQRIEEFMNNGSYAGATACPDSAGGREYRDVWNGQLFAKQVMPFVDMTVKGFVWYQGENNMNNVKGNAAADVGYSCKQRELVKGWRAAWSETPGTTNASAPFGVVTLASSGTEGGPNMGAMRLAQTAGYGVLPNEEMPNTFLAQAGELDDAWGPATGPCFSNFATDWGCCSSNARGPYSYRANRSSATCKAGTNGHPEMCDAACAAAAGTPSQGGIHPRSKLPVGDRLAVAAFNSVYGGTAAMTGPTLSGCAVGENATSLTIEFNTTLLRGDTIMLNSYNSSLNNEIAPPPPLPAGLEQCYSVTKSVCASHLRNYTDCRACKEDPVAWAKLEPVCGSRPINNFHEACKSFFPQALPLRGSLVEVLVGQGGADGSAAFCIEQAADGTCPSWAGPVGAGYNPGAGKWVTVDILSAGASGVTVDLSALELNGTAPAAVRYSWGVFECCNTGDPTLYVSKPCNETCPITSTSMLPANPFMAMIDGNGTCACVAPQQCGAK